MFDFLLEALTERESLVIVSLDDTVRQWPGRRDTQWRAQNAQKQRLLASLWVAAYSWSTCLGGEHARQTYDVARSNILWSAPEIERVTHLFF